MRNRVLLALALVAAAVIGPAGAAHAQCGPAKSTAESLTTTEVAFVGRVVDRSNLDRTAVMEVLEVWKGDSLPPLVTVNGGPEDMNQFTSIDRRYLLGQIYLVMPANARAPFLDSLCTGTTLWTTPDGTIPEEFQLATGNIEPIPVVVGADGGEGNGALSWLVDNVGVGLVVLALALGVIYSVKAISSKPTTSFHGGRTTSASREVRPDVPPTAAFRRRKRRGPSFSLPRFEWRGSRLDRFRRANKRGKKGSGQLQTEHLERVVHLKATTPPKRKNHYTSGRRSAP